MPGKYTQLISEYCAERGIRVPPAFKTAQRYAIIRTHLTPPKLIAKTWFNAEDVIYYLEHFLLTELGDRLSDSIQILDFKDNKILTYTGGKRLQRSGRPWISKESGNA